MFWYNERFKCKVWLRVTPSDSNAGRGFYFDFDGSELPRGCRYKALPLNSFRTGYEAHGRPDFAGNFPGNVYWGHFRLHPQLLSQWEHTDLPINWRPAERGTGRPQFWYYVQPARRKLPARVPKGGSGSCIRRHLTDRDHSVLIRLNCIISRRNVPPDQES